MRVFKKVILFLLLILLVFVGHLLISTGFFRTIEPHFEGSILKKVPIKGAEDIMVSRLDSFAIISATNRHVYPPTSEEKGGLHLIDLKADNYTPIALTTNFKRPFAPHGISFHKKDSSYRVMVINHANKTHSIEVFELKGTNLKYLKTLKHPLMIQPNDLVLVDENRFYFTNDHKYTEGLGRFIEDYGGIAMSNVIYFDGEEYREVADDIAYANGINIDFKRNLVYVASPRGFLVKVYRKEQNGSLVFIEDIDCDTGVDNIELDTDGNLWIGAHPNLLRFASYAKGKKETAPSEIIKITYNDVGDYSVEKIYVEDGSEMSASTVAATFNNLIFSGNVMDNEFLILERSTKEASK
ncbi:SMP-30/gluconolactonase/LRE family protein [Spongiivirga sp. MCCC 1A20706]|uniref:strictosidine synthase family protein n=1 Tax=Spongiivirga sp. MCCC 1A20706 TaxID=3160963 RepID=UPI003977C2C4